MHQGKSDLFSNLNCLESDFAEFLIKELGA